MRNSCLKLAKEWIIKAGNDLEGAEIIYREEGPSDLLCFHCHQAVEKHLKAFLVFKNLHFEKIHNLWNLAKLCSKEDKDFLNFEENFKTLDAYYVESRYPSEVKSYSRGECKDVLNVARNLSKFILDKII